MKLVDDASNWSKWWSVRLSIIGGVLLTILEGFPHAVATVISTLPSEITGTIDESVLKAIGIVCILASPIARVIKQRDVE
jgi:hypothetical protein